MIDLKTESLAEVKRILGQHVAGCEVRAFGSRVNGHAQRFSDLDLVVLGEGAFDARVLRDLQEALSLSDLPIMVDVLDWASLPQHFRAIIEGDFEIVQPGGEAR